MEFWVFEKLKIRDSSEGIKKLVKFGSDQCMLDQAGNQFLIWVPNLLIGSEMEFLM